MPFIHDRFLLDTPAGDRLYHQFAARQPIVDYHCHLSPRDIAENRRFANLFEIWLEGDHYKWRAMRAVGTPERYCTGDAPPYEKFLAWASTVPRCLRNPLYHWTHLELARYFGITDLLDEKTAPAIWARANEQLQSGDLDVHGILARFDVRVIGTTDDPADDLAHHRAIRAAGLPTRVVPTFRPDRALDVDQPEVFNPWLARLGAAANVDIVRFDDLVEALSRRHQDFHDLGGRLSDHGLAFCPGPPSTDSETAATFDKARAGRAVGPTAQEGFAAYMMHVFGRLDAEKGWTKQLHLGARRNVRTSAFEARGRDIGHDSIGDWPQVDALAAYLDRLDREQALPKVILYNNNPSDNYAMATMAASFQDEGVAGKVQFGSGWWHLDQKEGMEWQLNALSNTGLLSTFIGMTTDSRSFLSYCRHEYFRRVLCGLLGRDVERGELPDQDDLTGRLVEDICYRNAARYFGWEG
jgi:glucuronate isomerase